MKINKKFKSNIMMHWCIFLYATSNIFFKFASIYMESEGLFSIKCIGSMGVGIIILMIYAAFWQQTLKYFELNEANAIKMFHMIWGVFYAILIFKEKYELTNFIGLLLIILGIFIVFKKDKVKDN